MKVKIRNVNLHAVTSDLCLYMMHYPPACCPADTGGMFRSVSDVYTLAGNIVFVHPAAGQNPDHVLQGTGVKPGERRAGEDSTIAPEDAARFLSCYCSGHCPEDATNSTCQ